MGIDALRAASGATECSHYGLYKWLSAEGIADMQTLEGEGSQQEEDTEEFDSELLVRETFKTLFPDSFDGVLPIRKHKVRLSCPTSPCKKTGFIQCQRLEARRQPGAASENFKQK